MKTEYTKEQWARWAKYKSNKDLAIEQEEKDEDRAYRDMQDQEHYKEVLG